MMGALPVGVRTKAGARHVEWIPAHGIRFNEPFFEGTVTRLAHTYSDCRRVNRPLTPLDALRDVSPGVPLSGLIFHVSRCGSTLISRMLAALPRNIVASEPRIIDDLVRGGGDDPGITDEDRIAWLRGAVHSLGAPREGAERLFVKLDCWHIFALPLLQRAFPGVPLLFVHRHPLEVLVSLLRQPSFTLLPGTVTAEQIGLSEAECAELLWDERAAAILGAFFRAALVHRAAIVPVGYEQLPRFVWDAMPGVVFTDEERTRMQEATQVHSKDPSRPFTADTAEKRSEASESARAACARWAEPHYERWRAALAAIPSLTLPA